MANGTRYWWVNQKQTHAHEIAGGYLWSPKRNQNGARNRFYENMREVSPGDLVFSYWDGQIRAVGVAQSFCYDALRPAEFGDAGKAWADHGYRVLVRYTTIDPPIVPKGHWDQIKPLLPAKYSPLQHETGEGLQGVYLAEVSEDLGGLLCILARIDREMLRGLASSSSSDRGPGDERREFEDKIERTLCDDASIPETERVAQVKSRIGQGQFRDAVFKLEKCCRLTGITKPDFLIASHIKPWRLATPAERLDGHNGLLLTPNADFLFDQGFISFSDDGNLLISPVVDRTVLLKLGLPDQEGADVGPFNDRQKAYLSFHRAEVFRKIGE